MSRMPVLFVGHGDQREVSRAQEVRAQNEEGESRGEEAQGQAAYAALWTAISASASSS